MKAPRTTAPVKRVLHLHLAAAFLFFLVGSAPHRVHHFFEQGTLAPQSAVVTHSHDAGEDDPGHPHAPQAPGNAPDCAVQSLAQNAHAAAPSLGALPLEEFACARIEHLAVARAASFNPSPFSQRAPPLA
jgi:hypothetical protein